MGQQQILLVIIVTIIVSIATVAALNTFLSFSETINVDAMRDDLSKIALAAQGYYYKPDMLSGGGNSFKDFLFENLSLPGFDEPTENGRTITSEYGTYSIIQSDSNELIIEAIPSGADDQVYTAVIQPDSFELQEGEMGQRVEE